MTTGARGEPEKQDIQGSDDSTHVEPEMNPEFRKQYDAVYTGWQAGDIPFSDALDQMNALRAEAEKTNNHLHMGVIENGIGIMLGYRSNFSAAIERFERSRDHYQQAGALRRICNTTLNLGETYRLRGNFTRARAMFHRAYEEAKKLDVKAVQAIALANEGQMWLSLRSADKAQSTLEAALELALEPWEDPESETRAAERSDHTCEVYYALATVAMHNQDPERAFEYAVKSYDLAGKLNRPLRIGLSNRALGTVISALDDVPDDRFTSDPDEYYATALQAFKDIKAEGEVAKTLFAQGESLVRRGKRRQASRLFQQAMVIFTKLGMTEDAARAAEAQLDVI